MREYRHFLTIAVLLLCLLAIGIGASVNRVPEASKIIVAALAGFALLIKAWVEKARGHTSWFATVLAEVKEILRFRIEQDRRGIPPPRGEEEPPKEIKQV